MRIAIRFAANWSRVERRNKWAYIKIVAKTSIRVCVKVKQAFQFQLYNLHELGHDCLTIHRNGKYKLLTITIPCGINVSRAFYKLNSFGKQFDSLDCFLYNLSWFDSLEQVELEFRRSWLIYSKQENFWNSERISTKFPRNATTFNVAVFSAYRCFDVTAQCSTRR